MTLKLTSKLDDSFFDYLQERSYRLEQVEVEYGFYEDKMHKGSGLPAGTLASIQEFGSVTRNIPARPFVVYSAFLLNDKDIDSMRKASIDFLFKKKPALTSFRNVGRLGVRSIQRSIISQKFTPLAPKTVAAKGFSTILVENHELINLAEWKVNEKS